MKYFGTDGIRGKYGELLEPEFIAKLGKSAGKVFNDNNIKTICIGEDTRISSPLIANILISSLNSMGINTVYVNVVSTPMISYTIVNNESIDAGIMISASHNPYYDNGIKFFGENGKKISEKLENDIEKELDNIQKLNIEKLGQNENNDQLVNKYTEFLINLGEPLKGYKIGLDLANGSASKIAAEVFEKLGAEIHVIGNQPNGYNINDKIGSTHPEKIKEIVKEKKLNCAFAYDGDADRVQLIDNTGELLDGDYILYILAYYLKNNNLLPNDYIVSTVMANLGYKKAINELGLIHEETAVGDKYVMSRMDEVNSILGGEQSGHIIMSNFISTGDGILTSVILSKVLKKIDFDFELIKSKIKKYPQILKNYKCTDKNKILENKEFNDYIKNLEKEISNDGRILIRPSGTEQLIRVMVEHLDEKKCQKIINEIIEKIEKI